MTGAGRRSSRRPQSYAISGSAPLEWWEPCHGLSCVRSEEYSDHLDCIPVDSGLRSDDEVNAFGPESPYFGLPQQDRQSERVAPKRATTCAVQEETISTPGHPLAAADGIWSGNELLTSGIGRSLLAGFIDRRVIWIEVGAACPTESLCQLHVFRLHLVLRCQIAPGQGAFLAVGFAERNRETSPRQFFAQIERMVRLVHAEPRKEISDVGDVSAADEAFAVQNRDRFSIRENAKVGIGDAELQRTQFVFGEVKNGRILDGE